LGLIRDSLVLSLMPLDMKDAWIAAFNIPNFFRRFLGEGGLSVSFIPVYVASLKKGDLKGQKRLTDGVFSLLMGLVLLICGVSFFLMDQIVPLWLSGEGFSEVPGKLAMTVLMAKIMIFFLFFVTLFAYFMALLNSHKQFGHSGYAPLFLNLAIIAGLWTYRDSDQLAAVSAWSVVVGGGLQALFLLPSVRRLRIRPQVSLRPLNPEVQKVLMKFLPAIMGVGVLQILNLINKYFASQIRGAVSYLYVGDRLLELPLSLIAVSLGTTLLPTLSDYWAQGRRDTFIHSVSKHLSLFYFLAIPSAFGFWFIGTDIVEVLFKRGEFTLKEVEIVGTVLKIYCLTLIAAGSLKILNQSFYATGDTHTPALISGGGLLVHIFLAPLLMSRYQLNGLVLSTALVTSLNFVVGLVIVQKRIAPLNWKSIVRNILGCAAAGAVMGAYLLIINHWAWKQGHFLVDFPILMAVIVVGGALYFAVAAILKVDELQFLFSKLKRR
jgi:putative peptidoglycan lipid II flippase